MTKEKRDHIIIDCEIEAIGEHLVLLDLIVSRLHNQFDIISAGWEEKKSEQKEY